MTERDDAGPVETMSEWPELDTTKVAYKLRQPTGMMLDIFIGSALGLDGDERD